MGAGTSDASSDFHPKPPPSTPETFLGKINYRPPAQFRQAATNFKEQRQGPTSGANVRGQSDSGREWGGGSGAGGEGCFRLLPNVPALTLQTTSSVGI